MSLLLIYPVFIRHKKQKINGIRRQPDQSYQTLQSIIFQAPHFSLFHMYLNANSSPCGFRADQSSDCIMYSMQESVSRFCRRHAGVYMRLRVYLFKSLQIYNYLIFLSW